jgi:AGZA family xanthine/uracil permease-like MFS transporter
MRWFTRGDLDGFFGLALDNLVQLLVIISLWGKLGFPESLLYQHVLPGVAVSLLVGNLFYGWQARRLARREGRSDVCALPYGINTVSLFAHFFFVLLPAKIAAEADGAADPARVAWQAGLVACLASGVIEFVGSFIAERIRTSTPRAALLSTLAGIALTFICLSFFFQTFSHPVVGLATLGIIFLTYFGQVKFRGGLPGGLVAVALGTFLAWTTGIGGAGAAPLKEVYQHAPVPVLGDLLDAVRGPHFMRYLSVIIPMGIFNLIGSLQNIESAEAAGDRYSTAPSLAVNGVGSVAAALFGSCFPTTIYIGHPGWKALGARAGYSVLNGFFFTVVCLTGTLQLIAWAVPVDAGMAMVIWIGIVITAQAFQATPRQHAPAVVVGLLPGVAAWGTIMAKNALRAAGYGIPGGPAFSSDLIGKFLESDTRIDGAFALEQGFIFTSMILSAATVAVIERHFVRASIWCGIAALLSAMGLMHSYTFVFGDTAVSLTPAWPWVQGYLIMGACFVLAPWLTVPDKGHG